MNWGQWTAQAAPGTLTLHAEAADQENLKRIQENAHRPAGNLRQARAPETHLAPG